MLFVISPAKTLDLESSAMTEQSNNPAFVKEASELVNVLRELSAEDLKSLMGISEKIALLNVDRYRNWSAKFSLENSKQAIFAFKGDVYTGINIETCSQKQIDYLEANLRILSGLYGVLRPLDLMQPYRLEMGIKLENPKGKNLYEFWGEKITDSINEALGKSTEPVLVNLASNEYFKSIKSKQVEARIVTPVFKDLKNGQYKIISFYAKKARGLMVRYAADIGAEDVEMLKGFNYEGYQFCPSLSDGDEWVFTRDEAPGKQ